MFNIKLTEKNKIEYIRFGLLIVTLILFNLVSSTFFFRFDLTSNHKYTLSASSKNTVSHLSEPVTIEVFISKNLKPPYNTMEKELQELLNRYKFYAHNKLNYMFYHMDAADDSETMKGYADKATAYSINTVTIETTEKDERSTMAVYLGVVITHGDIIETIPMLNPYDNLEYKFTTTLKKMVDKINSLQALENGEMAIKVYYTPGYLEGLDTSVAKIEDTVKELKKKYFNKIDYQIFNTQKDPQTISEAVANNIFALPIVEKPLKPEDYLYAGIMIEYGGKKVNRELISIRFNIISGSYVFDPVSTDSIKSFLEGAIPRLLGIVQDIGYLADHGNPPLYSYNQYNIPGMPQALTNFNQLMYESYNVQQVYLKKEEIPENIKTLIIAGPLEEFSEYELYKLDQFVMKGGSLALFIDSFREVQSNNPNPYYQAPPQYMPVQTGLENLLDSYGLKVKKSYVFDEHCYKDVNKDNSGQSQKVKLFFVPEVLKKNINPKLGFIYNIKKIYMFKNSPVIFDPLKQPQTTGQYLFKTSDLAWDRSENIILYDTSQPGLELREQFDLGYLLEGTLTSYFKGKALPVKSLEQEEEAQDQKPREETPKLLENIIPNQELLQKSFVSGGNEGKILLIGSSAILTDSLIISEQSSYPNSMLIINLIDYLNGRKDVAVMRAKGQFFNPLNETDSLTKNIFKIFNTGGLIIIVIIAGLAMLFYYKDRQRKIILMFGKK